MKQRLIDANNKPILDACCKEHSTTETKTYQNGLSKTCRYRDNSMHHVCYFGGKATRIESCVGCHEDGRNAERGKWIDDDHMHELYHCSNCMVIDHRLPKHNFCPSCGADMREDDDKCGVQEKGTEV